MSRLRVTKNALQIGSLFILKEANHVTSCSGALKTPPIILPLRRDELDTAKEQNNTKRLISIAKW